MKKRSAIATVLAFLAVLLLRCGTVSPGEAGNPPEVAAVAFVLVVQANSDAVYHLTIKGPDMDRIGPNTYKSGESALMYVPEGPGRSFHFEKYQDGTLVDTGTTVQDIVSGINTVTVTLVSVSPVSLPALVIHPSDKSVTVGGTATFAVEATGDKLQYQWQKGTTNIPGANSSIYTTPSATASDNNATYRCVITNSAGSVTSNTATLTVSMNVVTPAITSHPENQSITTGQKATFSVTASGTDLGYQWQKGTTDIPGATENSYTTPAVSTAENNAQYRCVVTNSAGSATSNHATLTVTPSVIRPAITQHPSDQAVTQGQPATFSVVATGTDLQYQWQKGTTNIAGATLSSYTTPATTLADNNATYRCVVSNSAGSKSSNAATLTVNQNVVAPAITQHPSNQSVTEGQTATFSVVATGSNLEFQWAKGTSSILGATSSTYTTPEVSFSDNNSTYWCLVTNTAGNVSSSPATLTVQKLVISPSITQHPRDVHVSDGSSATLTLEATGTDLTYQWQRNKQNIQGATGATYSTPVLWIGNGDDGSMYRCIVSNQNGSVTSDEATVFVDPKLPDAPRLYESSIGSYWAIHLVLDGDFNNMLRVYRSPNAGGVFTVIGDSISYNHFYDTGLVANTTYYYKAKEFNSVGESTFSDEIKAITAQSPTTPPGKPTYVKATAPSKWAMLRWNPVNPPAHYIVYRSTVSAGPYTAVADGLFGTPGSEERKYNDNTTDYGTEYFYQVSAVNAAGESAKSEIASCTTPPKP